MSEQERNLRKLRVVPWLLAAALVIVGALLYRGNELPFYEMRRQATDATGYRPPPASVVAVGDSVPRGVGNPAKPLALAPALPPPPIARTDRTHAPVPPAASALANPLANDRSAAKEGQALYEINCIMCHGKSGSGDAPVGQSYTPRPPDLNGYALSLPPGALYYLITYGIRSTPIPEAASFLPDEWHSYRPIMTERERWAAVSYLKTGLGGTHAIPGR